ncbi:MAG: GIY-YIG nuclease family protein [Hyphomonadaceae bacterium]
MSSHSAGEPPSEDPSPGGQPQALLTFNHLLELAGLDLKKVRLVRHQGSGNGRSPYRLWMDDRSAFERYQAMQSPSNRAKLAQPLWAVFVAGPDAVSLFVGLYEARCIGPSLEDQIAPHSGALIAAGRVDSYTLTLTSTLAPYAGKLCVDWGEAHRSWIQRADLQVKPITELRAAIREPEFPGYVRFVRPLSEIENMPSAWKTALSAARGVYVLTCPRTREQYVGCATGDNGFLGRWLDYVRNGHGGNVGLKSREPSDYQISILEVAHSSATRAEIEAAEALWKRKLQCRDMGLSRN